MRVGVSPAVSPAAVVNGDGPPATADAAAARPQTNFEGRPRGAEAAAESLAPHTRR